MSQSAVALPVLTERNRLREIGVPALIVAGVLLLSIVSLLDTSFSALRANFAAVQLSNAVLLDLAEVNTQTIGVDFSVRGYALTNDAGFLTRLADRRVALRKAIDHLAHITSAEPGASARLAELRRRVARQEDIYDRLAALGPGHAKEVGQAIVDPAKREVRFAVLRWLDSMRDAELKQLQDRRHEAERQVRHTYYVVFGVLVLSFIAGAIGLSLTVMQRDWH